MTREYYVNDAGAQIARFAASQLAAARGRADPGGRLRRVRTSPRSPRACCGRNPGLPNEAPEAVLETFAPRRRRASCSRASARRSTRFGVHFDVWFSERSLATSGAVEHALDRLKAEGHTYEADGALWLRTTDFGDDKDRVLVKSDGATSYFTSDAAYYLDKRERGYDRCIYILGADHHGYIGRLRAMVGCFGDDPNQTLEIMIGQLVNVLRGGEPVRMSKRAGTFITLDDLVELVGVDAARYSLARSSIDSALDIDIDLLAEPHQRQSGLLRPVRPRPAGEPAAQRRRTRARPRSAALTSRLLTHEREGDLLRALGEFPRIVAAAADRAGAASRRALPRGAGRHLPPLLRRLPGAAAGRRGGRPAERRAAACSSRPPASSSPTGSACSASALRSGCSQ